MKHYFRVSGMTCQGCENRISRALKQVEGVEKVSANANSGEVTVECNTSGVDEKILREKIETAGYKVESSGVPGTKEKFSLSKLLGLGIIGIALFIIIQNTIGLNFLPQIDQSMSYGLIFIAGLLTSVHCMGMCGGIAVSQCIAGPNSSPQGSIRKSSLVPSILYNSGRLVSYTLIGGIVGALGSALTLTGSAKGIISLLAGLIMALIGLSMLNLLPFLKRIPFLPHLGDNKIFRKISKSGPFAVGLLNGLMPCGPLQTMQIYALGTGSFIAGALSMGIFTLGTIPLLFLIGSASTFFSGKMTKTVFKFSGVFIIVLGLIMVNRGLSLSGVYVPGISANTLSSVASISGNIQTVKIDVKPNSYEQITIQKGLPVRWIISAKEGNLNGCNNKIIVPSLGIEKPLLPGDNVVEFTAPDTAGTIPYSCWMGMIQSSIKVVDDIKNPVAVAGVNPAPTSNPVAAGGCACCGGGSANASLDVNNIAVGKIQSGVQTVKMTIDRNGFSPNVILLQRGVKTKWILDAKELTSCNYRLLFPALNASLELEKGANEIDFTPLKDVPFSCWMGMLNGYVKVVDDIKTADLSRIKRELAAYTPGR